MENEWVSKRGSGTIYAMFNPSNNYPTLTYMIVSTSMGGVFLILAFG